MEEKELLILYYYCHSFYGKNFQNLILKYNLLEHLHPLTKLEFKNKYELLTIDNELYVFTEELAKSIDRNLDLASSLDRIEAINESSKYSPYEIILSFNIDIDFKFDIQYNHTENVKIPFAHDFCDYITHFLYDKFYYSKFIVPVGNEIELFTTKTDDKTTFSYIIKSNNLT